MRWLNYRKYKIQDCLKNEANLFDEEKLKEYIANMQGDAEAGDNQAWLNWLATEKSIKQNLVRQAYTTLVTAGLGASLKEAPKPAVTKVVYA